MFKATFERAQTIKSIFDSIKDLTSAINIQVNARDGFVLQSIDSSHVLLVVLNLPPSLFSTFECDVPMTLGVHLPHLFKILKCAENDASITFTADKDTSHLDIEFAHRQRCARFSLNLIDLDADHLDIPPAFYALRTQIGSQHFQRIIRDIAQLGSTCSITCESDSVVAFGTHDSDVVTEGSIQLHTGDDMIIFPIDDQMCDDFDEEDIDRDPPRNLQVSCRFLEQIIKATPLSKHVMLSVSNSRPLLIEYIISKRYVDGGFEETKSDTSHDGETQAHGKLAFFVAPKINDDE